MAHPYLRRASDSIVRKLDRITAKSKDGKTSVSVKLSTGGSTGMSLKGASRAKLRGPKIV